MNDFHIHSTYSDGLDSIENLIQKTRNFTMFSITDHNNIEANKRIREANFITGVELSTYFLDNVYHILGYNFDVNNKELNNKDLFDIYDKYVKYYCQNIKYYYTSIKDIIINIKNANGYLVLAHPFISCKNTEPKTIIEKFLSHGGDGIEITSDYIDKSIEIVNYYDIIYSVGSDYHSDKFNRNNTLGIDTKYFDNDERYLGNVIRRKGKCIHLKK